MTDNTLLIRNADLLCTMNPADAGALKGTRPGDNAGAEIRGGGLFARDGVIEMVGPGDTLPDSADTMIDMTGHVVIPGMVNTHRYRRRRTRRCSAGCRRCIRSGRISGPNISTGPPHWGLPNLR
jgi:hypothetical protein